jgi:type II secretory pathway predicted ATPase ExeA
MNTQALDTQEEEQKDKLVRTAKLIEDWRLAVGVPKDKMAARFPGLIKSYRNVERAIAGELSEMDIPKNLAAFESVWAMINSPAPKPAQKPYDDFGLVLELRNAPARTMTKTGPNRVILVTGPTGRGKSKALEALQNLYRARVLGVSASRVWRDKPSALLKEIWKAMGKTGSLGHGPDALDRVAAALKETRVCLAIDEAHYMGPEQLNTVTSLIERTPGEFILVGQPSLWSKLENDKGAFQEARQLTKNRLSRRIRVGEITADDPEIKMLLERRLPWLDKVGEAVELLGQHASSHGNLGFVRNVIERCEEALEEGASEDWNTFKAALKDELAGR